MKQKKNINKSQETESKENSSNNIEKNSIEDLMLEFITTKQDYYELLEEFTSSGIFHNKKKECMDYFRSFGLYVSKLQHEV
ncbi:MAG TPA: hypothetical protein PK006_13100 [Saprospiraceae bacterium]|nr:hypothetical protein [Saprospiraceae bacterium]